MHMEKGKLKQILDQYPELLWRSMYGNTFNLGGTQCQDVKVYGNHVVRSEKQGIDYQNDIFLSTDDISFKKIVLPEFKNPILKIFSSFLLFLNISAIFPDCSWSIILSL